MKSPYHNQIGKPDSGSTVALLSLPVWNVSILDTQIFKAGRVKNLTLNTVQELFITSFGYSNGDGEFAVKFIIVSGSTFVQNGSQIFSTSYDLSTFAAVDAACRAEIAIWASANSMTINAIDWAPGAAGALAPATTQAPATRSIVTGTGATGFQPSATRDVFANYNLTVATTATIGGSASGTLVLEICSTNSSTPANWIEVARFTNGQSISLAIALQSIQTLAGQLSGMIPAGYYAKIRSINNSGTPTYTYNSGQEVLL